MIRKRKFGVGMNSLTFRIFVSFCYLWIGRFSVVTLERSLSDQLYCQPGNQSDDQNDAEFENNHSYSDSPFIWINHPLFFNISDGIVPLIMYEVKIDVPPGNNFILEYNVKEEYPEGDKKPWVQKTLKQQTVSESINSGSSTGPSTNNIKKRHESNNRKKRNKGSRRSEISHELFIQLFLNEDPHSSFSSSFCTKNSVGGLNYGNTTSTISFQWIVKWYTAQTTDKNDLKINYQDNSYDSYSTMDSFPTSLAHEHQIMFRSRIWVPERPDEPERKTTLYVPIQTDCILHMGLSQSRRLGLKDLRWISQTSRSSSSSTLELPLNCSIYIYTRASYGLTVEIEKLSLYGIRGMCNSHFFSISPTRTALVNKNSRSIRYCGKLEEYRDWQRNITFPSANGDGENLTKSSSGDNLLNAAVILRVQLDKSIGPRESFTIKLSPLSPCEQVALHDLEGKFQYSFQNAEIVDECSITVHVPFGYAVLTEVQITLNQDPKTIPDSYPTCSSGSDLQSLKNKLKLSSHDYLNQLLIIESEDVLSRSKYSWCFDYHQSYQQHAWKSAGNHIELKFKVNSAYLKKFKLTYKAVKVDELVRDCNKGWVSFGTYDDSCVLLVPREMSWFSAEEICNSDYDAHLISVNDFEEQVLIQQIIANSATFGQDKAYWIGASDREYEGLFQWTNGNPFDFTYWFPGWKLADGKIIRSQPNDDSWSGQDCVEMRQVSVPKFLLHEHPQSLSVFHSSENELYSRESTNLGKFPTLYWNDQTCDNKNYFICQKAVSKTRRQGESSVPCNQTYSLKSEGERSIVFTSPNHPGLYPGNQMCFITLNSVAGYKIIVDFLEFKFEDSTRCSYDSLEIHEVVENIENISINLNQSMENSSSHVNKYCGDWSKQLKLLRFVSSRSGSSVVLLFQSDFSHHFSGFKAQASLLQEPPKDCSAERMEPFDGHCYLIVPFPRVNWNTAHHICNTLQANLSSVVSWKEWKFLSDKLQSIGYHPSLKSIVFWLGGHVDENDALTWIDKEPFNFSVFHPSDLQAMSDWRCLSAYHDSNVRDSNGNRTFAWKLTYCSENAGYICKKRILSDKKHFMKNKTYSGTSGKINSMNFPENYDNYEDYTSTLLAPQGTRIVVRFTFLSIESQEHCLYDYLELIDGDDKNGTRYCGTYSRNNLPSLDYVSKGRELKVHFHSDFETTEKGFELVWRAVDVSTCEGGRTLVTGIGYGFPIHEATLHSPNFPYFNLPGLDCHYTILAPVGQRVWLSFHAFEIGSRQHVDGSCDDDYVTVQLGESVNGFSPNLKNVTLCGNLTSLLYKTTFLSYGEQLKIHVHGKKGKTGRGFLGRFKAIAQSLKETIKTNLPVNSSTWITSLNYPAEAPPDSSLTVVLTCKTNYILMIRARGIIEKNCAQWSQSYIEISDPYANKSLSHRQPINIRTICQPHEASSVLNFTDERMENLVDIAVTSSFNRLDIKQVYRSTISASGWKWTAQVFTNIDKNFREKVKAGGDNLLIFNGCDPNPCANGGSCVNTGRRHICRCPLPYTGPFCGLTLCDLEPCLFGKCELLNTSYSCKCELGYGGSRCDRRMKPCQDHPNPCSGHGDCVEVNLTSYMCQCHAWYQGVQCESRMVHIPYRPLSQRMLQEPFWLGIISVVIVLAVIGACWCFKRHFPEKLEKLLGEDPDTSAGISWVSGRSPSSFRISRGSGGGGSALGLRDPVPGTSQSQNAQTVGGASTVNTSPTHNRSFFNKLGLRKPSLLSLSSAASGVSVTAAPSPHTYENRTFSLDDLLKPNRSSIIRTPSPRRRRNYSIQSRRDPSEKQQILQQLVNPSNASGDGSTPSKPSTPKPTLAEIIQMSEKRLRLASMASMEASKQGAENETSFISGEKKQSGSEKDSIESTANIAATKAEKKVTFARMLDKLAATEMSSSSSELSAGEELMNKMTPAPITTSTIVHQHPFPQKFAGGRKFRRSKSFRTYSETDQDVSMVEMSSSDTTPDPVFQPRFPTRLSLSPSRSISPTCGNVYKNGSKIMKMASADSLISMFRRFSGSSSAPPSPQYSENEDYNGQSSAAATPVSTPGSPRSSNLSLSIRPPAFQITSADFSSGTNSTTGAQDTSKDSRRAGSSNQQSNIIALEVPFVRDYCLSPIHEVATPISTPCPSPAHSPLMKRNMSEIELNNRNQPLLRTQSSEDDECLYKKQKRILIPAISISDEHGEERFEQLATEATSSGKDVIPDVLMHHPSNSTVPDIHHREKVEKQKPPPLILANEILSSPSSEKALPSNNDSPPEPNVVIPILHVQVATPTAEERQMIGDVLQQNSSSPINLNRPLIPPTIMINGGSEESDSDHCINKSSLGKSGQSFLVPFVGRSDRIPSESNLSTSGYSSMASPCPSRCPSVSPLCPNDEVDSSTIHTAHSQSLTRRSSLNHVIGVKKPNNPSFCRRLSLNSAMADFDKRDVTWTALVEVDSAVELEADVDTSHSSGGKTKDDSKESRKLPPEEIQVIRQNLLQVPKRGISKSRSLEIDTKKPGSPKKSNKQRLNSKSQLLLLESLEIDVNRRLFTDPNSKGRLSPVSSRSESPISEAMAGNIDDSAESLASSELTPSGSLFTITKQTDIDKKRSNIKKKRYLNLKSRQKLICMNDDEDVKINEEASADAQTLSQDGSSSFKSSPSKRRVRAQPLLDTLTSSSSNESVYSGGSCSRAPFSNQSYSGSYSESKNLENSPKQNKKEISQEASSPGNLENVECQEHSQGTSSVKEKNNATGLAGPYTSSAPSTTTERSQLNDKNGGNEGDRSGPSPATARRKDCLSPIRARNSKLSRLRAITNQIRFVRRLELSLLRKREYLKTVNYLDDSSDKMLSKSHQSIDLKQISPSLESIDYWSGNSGDEESSLSSTCSTDSSVPSSIKDDDMDVETPFLKSTQKTSRSKSSKYKFPKSIRKRNPLLLQYFSNTKKK